MRSSIVRRNSRRSLSRRNSRRSLSRRNSRRSLSRRNSRRSLSRRNSRRGLTRRNSRRSLSRRNSRRGLLRKNRRHRGGYLEWSPVPNATLPSSGLPDPMAQVNNNNVIRALTGSRPGFTGSVLTAQAKDATLTKAETNALLTQRVAARDNVVKTTQA
jgi:hypothetical protein